MLSRIKSKSATLDFLTSKPRSHYNTHLRLTSGINSCESCLDCSHDQFGSSALFPCGTIHNVSGECYTNIILRSVYVSSVLLGLVGKESSLPIHNLGDRSRFRWVQCDDDEIKCNLTMGIFIILACVMILSLGCFNTTLIPAMRKCSEYRRCRCGMNRTSLSSFWLP